MAEATLTWLGHATWHLQTATGTRVMIDPFTVQSPVCPDQWKEVSELDLILCTHGHFDHVADAATVAKATGATLVGQPELCALMGDMGAPNLAEMNKGGTQELAGLKVTMVHAQHSSSFPYAGRTVYTGEAAGYVIELEDGYRIYHAGDTNVFSDMRLIGELYTPDLALLPIGDHYTMDPREAALAVRLLGVRDVIGMHYGTFPPLTGRPRDLAAALEGEDVSVHELQVGGTHALPTRVRA